MTPLYSILLLVASDVYQSEAQYPCSYIGADCIHLNTNPVLCDHHIGYWFFNQVGKFTDRSAHSGSTCTTFIQHSSSGCGDYWLTGPQGPNVANYFDSWVTYDAPDDKFCLVSAAVNDIAHISARYYGFTFAVYIQPLSDTVGTWGHIFGFSDYVYTYPWPIRNYYTSIYFIDEGVLGVTLHNGTDYLGEPAVFDFRGILMVGRWSGLVVSFNGTSGTVHARVDQYHMKSLQSDAWVNGSISTLNPAPVKPKYGAFFGGPAYIPPGSTNVSLGINVALTGPQLFDIGLDLSVWKFSDLTPNKDFVAPPLKCNGTETPCANDGYCIETSWHYKCLCKSLVAGPYCEYACDSNPCFYGGTCVNHLNGTDHTFYCECAPRTTGSTCGMLFPPDPCLSDPCSNNGTCVEFYGYYECECPFPYVGAHCNETNFCKGPPCMNNGICTVINDEDYHCDCAWPYVGKSCETQLPACFSNPCANGATCVDVNDGDAFFCDCSWPYEGTLCQTSFPACRGNPCLNDGTCVESDDTLSYTCNCDVLYMGERCENSAGKCASNPCKNNAECNSTVSNGEEIFICECAPMYKGILCETTMSCDEIECQNAGICVDDSPPKCNCWWPFNGTFCEELVCDCAPTHCISSPCQNDAICAYGGSEGTPICRCESGFTGEFCESVDVRTSGDSGATCEDEVTSVPGITLEKPSLFSPLTDSEIMSVMGYILGVGSFKVTEVEDATIGDTWILSIELLPPSKPAALDYLDGSGSKPTRQAVVTLISTASHPSTVKIYSVGPVDKPSSHSFIQQLSIEDDILLPWPGAQPLRSLWQNFLQEALQPVSQQLKDATGGYSLSPSCALSCLSWRPSIVPSLNDTVLITFLRDRDTAGQVPIGLQILVKTSPPWQILQLLWRGDVFSTVADLLDSFPANTTVISTEDKSKPDPLLSKIAAVNSLPKGCGQITSGPTVNFTNGVPRVEIHEKSNTIEWLGWDFEFGTRSNGALYAYNVKFRDERIMYELILEDIMHYSSGEIPDLQILSLQGFSISSLYPRVHCPHHAQFINSVFYHQGDLIYIDRAICAFEIEAGEPLWIYNKLDISAASIDNALVIRTFFANMYLLDYIFHQSGAVEVRISITGYTHLLYKHPNNVQYGYQGDPGLILPIQIHAAHFKLDLDVNGIQNQIEAVDLKWETDQNVESFGGDRLYYTHHVTDTEKEAVFEDFPHRLLVSNKAKKNRYGNNQAYNIELGNSAANTELMQNISQFFKQKIAFTKQKDSEDRMSVMLGQMPSSYGEDNEHMENTDIVTWVSLTSVHTPTSEHFPITTTSPSMTFTVTPHNRYDLDPSLTSADVVKVIDNGGEGDEEGEGWSYEFGGGWLWRTCGWRHALYSIGVVAGPVASVVGVSCCGAFCAFLRMKKGAAVAQQVAAL